MKITTICSILALPLLVACGGSVDTPPADKLSSEQFIAELSSEYTFQATNLMESDTPGWRRDALRSLADISKVVDTLPWRPKNDFYQATFGYPAP